MRTDTTVVIPAYNEEDRIGEVIEEVSGYVNEVLVVDDGSSDRTGKVASGADAEVLTHENNKGYLEALRTGFRNLESEFVVTLDADGEMNPEYIPELLEPLVEGEADLVLGKREKIPRLSEQFLSFLAGLKVSVSDTGTGFRALKSGLAEEMNLYGVCPCGTFVLEANSLGAEIKEVPVRTRNVEKPKRIAWKHFFQFWHVLRLLLSSG